MRNYHIKVGIVVLIAAAAGADWKAQEGEGPPISEVRQLRAALKQLEAEEWSRREEGFNQLISSGGPVGRVQVARPIRALLDRYPEQSEEIRLALIALLDRENRLLQRSAEQGQRLGEQWSDYYGDVIAATVTLNDPRSMAALLGAITTGGMVTRALAGFAPASLEPVLEKTRDSDPLVRNASLHILAEMLSPTHRDKVSDPASLSKIKAAFLRGVEDPVPIVRSAGVFGLAALGDKDAIPIVERLAESDPSFLPGQAEGGKNLYTVRLDARRALEELRAKTRKAQ